MVVRARRSQQISPPVQAGGTTARPIQTHDPHPDAVGFGFVSQDASFIQEHELRHDEVTRQGRCEKQHLTLGSADVQGRTDERHPQGKLRPLMRQEIAP